MSFPLLMASVAALLSAIGIGGALYEALVIDTAWPKNPSLIQPQQGGVLRTRFWIPAHVALELTLMAAIALNWASSHMRFLLLSAFACQAMMRIWSFMDFIPKALAFERMPPESVSETAARAWTARSLMRLPFSLAVTGLAFAAVLASQAAPV